MSVVYSLADAERIAAEAGVEVGLLTNMAALTEAAHVFETVWGQARGQVIPGEVLRAISFAGGYVSGARRDGVLVGASVGFLGRHDGELHLHSHISGVLPDAQGRHVGLALKQHQRAWALTRGISTIEWTFDPLVRRNAYFNLVKLGARVVGYEPAFYGAMHDVFNDGDETDRAVIRWDLEAPEASGQAIDGAVILRADDDGRPVASPTSGSETGALRAFVPFDIVEIRQRDALLAQAWRKALRETFGAAVRDGYVATAMSRDGWYTLVKGGA